jgi:hypothetical protein
MEKEIFRLNIPSKEELYKNLEVYKRTENTFYLRNEWVNFHIELTGKELFDFVDHYNVGDFINL